MTRICEMNGPDGRLFVYPDELGIRPYVESALFGTDYPDPFPGEYIAKTIIDIGAHVGSATRMFKSRYPTARIVAFEPNPYCFAILERNLCGIADVQLIKAGLSDLNGTAKLFSGRYSSMQASMMPNEENTTEYTEVECIDAAEALASRGVENASVVKLDAEGYELRILKALGRYVGSADLIYLEYHSERDRHAIDQLLSHGHIMFHANVIEPHRGTVAYIAEEILDKLQKQSKKPQYAFPKSR
jgi:FkbM family methyltransferase